MDYLISRRLSSDHLYAYSKKRFWFWDEARCVWTESPLMSQKYEREHTARPTLTPETFMTDLTKFQQLDEFELDSAMLDALKSAKPCKTAPIEPVKEERPTPSAQCLDAATAAESQTAASPAVPEVSSPTTETAPAAQNAAAPVSASEKNAALFAGSDSALSNPTAPGFDYSQFDEQTAQALQNFAFRALQVARTYYRDLMEIVVGAHKLLCGTIVHDVDNGKFAPKEDTFRAWCASVHISKSKAYQLLQIQSFMDTCTPEEQSTLALLPFTAMRELVTGDTPEQVITMAKEGKVGTSKEVLELKAQLKAEKARADTAEHQLEAAQADVAGLTEQNGQLKERVDAAESREEEAWKLHDKAETRARNAEEALKKQPVTTVVDKDEVQRQAKALARQWSEEEIDRQAAEKAWGLADARNAELQSDKDKLSKDNASLRKQLAALRSKVTDDAQADFETANFCASLFRSAWDTCKGSYSRLTGEDLESTFQALCGALNSIMEEASLLCRQPADYDGGADDEPDV